MAMSDSGGPYVQVAAFCEKVIVDRNVGNLSLIGLVETVTNTAVGEEVPDEMPPFSLGAITLAVCLWADKAKGRYTVKVRPENPIGEQMAPLTSPVQFESGARGVNLIVPMNLQIDHEGLYWFDVLLSAGSGYEDRLLTRIPLEVLYRPQQLPG
ncbi:MAG TPA: hypothetical protein VMI13_13950 [Solirubrobacteraceae bacterium]|nr:hypothetical protein [Solirubrobacteraceae bacterium]